MTIGTAWTGGDTRTRNGSTALAIPFVDVYFPAPMEPQEDVYFDFIPHESRSRVDSSHGPVFTSETCHFSSKNVTQGYITTVTRLVSPAQKDCQFTFSFAPTKITEGIPHAKLKKMNSLPSRPKRLIQTIGAKEHHKRATVIICQFFIVFNSFRAAPYHKQHKRQPER